MLKYLVDSFIIHTFAFLNNKVYEIVRKFLTIKIWKSRFFYAPLHSQINNTKIKAYETLTDYTYSDMTLLK